MHDNVDVLTDEEIDDTLYKVANNLPPAEISSKKHGSLSQEKLPIY